MNLILKEGKIKGGQLEFYLIGSDNYDDFDSVMDVLDKRRRIRPVERIDGIYSRTAIFELTDIGLVKIIYHDDVGIYAFSLKQSDDANSFLREILQEVVEEFNFLLRRGA